MKKIGCFFLMAAGLLLFVACGPKGVPGAVPVPERIAGDALAPLVRSIELVPLETHGDDFLGSGTSLILADGNYLLVDTGNKKLHLYGPDGKFLNRVGREGRGPGEYHSLLNVLYADGRIYVYQGDASLLVYRPDGTLEQVVTLPAEGGNAFFPLEDGYLAYIGNLRAGDDMIQWVREGQEPVSLVPKRGPMPIAMMQDRPFSEFAGRIFMPDAMGEKVYAFKDGKAETWLTLDFGRFKLGEEFFSGDVEVAFRIMSTRFAQIGAYWENHRMRVVFAVRAEKKEDSDPFPVREFVYGVFLHGKWNWISTGEFGESLFANSVSGLEDDSLVCLLDPTLLGNLDPDLRAKVSNPAVLETLNSDSNYVVAKLRLK